MRFDRQYRDCAIQLATHHPAVVVTGARQTGKTTFLRETFPHHTYVSLDLPSVAALAEQDPQRFLEQHKTPLLIDEVQYAPQLFRHLKIAIDDNRHAFGQFILTGSQKFVLMKGVADSLAGRCGLLELEGLSWEELHQHVPRAHAHHDRISQMVRGSFPELWRVPTMSSDDFFRSYVATYLERDVRQILNVGSLRDFERFVRACAARNAQTLDRSAIARDVGVSVKAIGDWTSVLEASNQIHLLEPYFSNIGKRLVKTPKMYFSDTGLLCYLLGLDDNSLSKSSMLGAVWEAACFAQLRKHRERTGSRMSLNFYRDSQQNEVDFVVSMGVARALVEVKWTENPTTSDTSVMLKVKRFLQDHDDSLQVPCAVACRTPSRTMIGPHVDVIDAIDVPQWLNDRFSS
jgi:uncharacterized protein